MRGTGQDLTSKNEIDFEELYTEVTAKTELYRLIS